MRQSTAPIKFIFSLLTLAFGDARGYCFYTNTTPHMSLHCNIPGRELARDLMRAMIEQNIVLNIDEKYCPDVLLTHSQSFGKGLLSGTVCDLSWGVGNPGPRILNYLNQKVPETAFTFSDFRITCYTLMLICACVIVYSAIQIYQKNCQGLFRDSRGAYGRVADDDRLDLELAQGDDAYQH